MKEGFRTGRPRKLSADDMKWVYNAITQGNPQQYQFSFCLWSLSVIRSMLRRELNIELSKSAISRLLSHLGLSPQRPIYKSYKQDPKKVENYISKTFPELVKEAKKLGAEIYFVDESAVRSDSHRELIRGKVGEIPVVKDSGNRFALKLISAVSPRGDMKFGFIEDKMNSAKFIQFLKKLRKDADRPIIVVVDNARYHVSRETRAFIEDNQSSIIMARLPAYSPELNPDEQVWNHAKARLGKLSVFDKESMRLTLMRIMRSIQRNKKLVASLFKKKESKYIEENIMHLYCEYFCNN